MVYDAPLCRVGGVASHNMDGTTIGVLMEHVVWKPAVNVSRRNVRVDSIRVATAGVERSREAAFIEAGVLPLSGQLARLHHSVSTGQLERNLLLYIEVQGILYRSLGIARTTTNPKEGWQETRKNYGLERRARGQQV